ncbi:MAG: PAS domain S-box protein [Clostridiales bacterium]|nr:PAS domain S-box protein [Clostridiales bacterium]MCF8022012.1 PAS domain S-box protein [Clostridiales bacterium]
MVDNQELQAYINNLSVFEAMVNIGIIIFKKDMTIHYTNPAIQKMLGCTANEIHDCKLEDVFVDFFASSKEEYISTSPTVKIIQNNINSMYTEREAQDGRIFQCCYSRIFDNNSNEKTDFFLCTFSEITNQKKIEQAHEQVKEELDQAFALTLPNSKVERKLKSTPEYRDNYNPDTGEIIITEVIEDGTYRHVINALKILADLKIKGVTDIIGLDKDLLVNVIVFHDLGKVQPALKEGDTVIPSDVFENGKLHADRSAMIAKDFYGHNDEAITLIKYHHHQENELPAEFPRKLLPMFRLFKIIDGLSAALTRREASVRFEVKGENILIFEKNSHQDYNKNRLVNLFTGIEKEQDRNGI